MLWKQLAALILALSVSACSSWVYRIDIPQGNYLEQKDVDKLRIKMTKEQVVYLIGHPVATNAFDNKVWHYVYKMDRGSSSAEDFQQELVVVFDDNDQLLELKGDFEVPETFNTPLEE